MKKAIITVVGQDTVGIIARVCTYLAENQVYIADWCDQAFRELKSACTKEWIKEC